MFAQIPEIPNGWEKADHETLRSNISNLGFYLVKLDLDEYSEAAVLGRMRYKVEFLIRQKREKAHVSPDA